MNTAQKLYLSLGVIAETYDRRLSPSNTKSGPGRRHLHGKLKLPGKSMLIERLLKDGSEGAVV